MTNSAILIVSAAAFHWSGHQDVAEIQDAYALLSPVLGGFVAQSFGFATSFVVLGGLSLGSLVIWLGFSPMLRSADSR